MHNLARLGAAALLSLLFAANAARAERESDGRAVRLGEQVTDSAVEPTRSLPIPKSR
jgi:hypothetical protein